MEKALAIALILSSILVFGCVQQTPSATTTSRTLSAADEAKTKCIALCLQEKQKGNDLSRGPCLSNKIIDDWVCDVAHSPRESVDNDPANQCPAFGSNASHFIEVNPECAFIKAV
ncbi:hypothetical protein HY991_04625 [Candidatus Micrarchaeota archaeon]|nr:hypothetical protein [Candidatus Micrarchaeota archaeon]